MNFSLALFLTREQATDADLFDCIDRAIVRFAAEKYLERWHHYDVSRPHTCLEQLPMAFITAQGTWYEPDSSLEKPAQRLVRRRQKAFDAMHKEEEAGDPEAAAARCLVRMATWEADHPFPLTPWRQLWRQALLDHADGAIVYLACVRRLALDGSFAQ